MSDDIRHPSNYKFNWLALAQIVTSVGGASLISGAVLGLYIAFVAPSDDAIGLDEQCEWALRLALDNEPFIEFEPQSRSKLNAQVAKRLDACLQDIRND